MYYDAIIIGSRVAGASTAMLLARRGYRVLVVDRATFPSDTISTHIVWQQGVSRLTDWGLGERLAALGAAPLERLDLDFGPVTLRATLPAVNGATAAFAPRRTKLDKMLVDAAAEAGAEVREGFAVDEILFHGDKVVGIRGHGKSGAPAEERAKVVIGADGVNSTLARAAKAPEYDTRPTLTCWYYSYWSGVPASRIRFFSRPGHAIGCLPTNDGAVCVPVAWPRSRFAEVKSDVEGSYMAALDVVPEFKEELMAAKREDRFFGTGHIPNYFRRPYGNGWALVGDAGYHKDPILAQGISDSFRDASLLSDALDRVFAGENWEESLAACEAERNRAVQGIYAMNAEFASLEPPPPETQMLIAALRGKQADIDQFAGTMTGAVRVEKFYAPDNIERILAATYTGAHAAAGHRSGAD